MEKFHESHLVIDVDNGRALDFQGEKRITYSDIATVLECKYHIAGVPDEIDGVRYRSSPKGWMSSQMLSDYFSNQNIITLLPGGRTRKLWIDSW